MRCAVLGPLEVVSAGRECTPSAPRLRTVLTLMLLRADQVVSLDELMSELWGDRLPASAVNSVQVFVTRLRTLLAPDRAARASDPVLRSSGAGYRLDIDPDLVDLHRFDRLAHDGEVALAAGNAATASRLLREALVLWRGAPFVDVRKGELLQMHGFRMEERRVRALEQRAEAELRLGRHAGLVGELEALAASYPVREELHGQLMLALYRSGRQAEAIDTYRRLRRRLVDELAVEPTAAVQRLHQAMLAGDPALEAPPSPVTLSAGNLERPGTRAQLPPDISDFTGRGDAVTLLKSPLAVDRGGDRTAVPVVTVAGEAGVGKTTLAVRCAHELRPHYPDGQLYLNLHGADPHPPDPGQALGRLLRGLGVDGSAIPETVEERSELLRSRTADQRLLLVLDDAAGEDQVRPLLPGGPSCGVVVTSRRRLPCLEGAVTLELGLFSAGEAVRLLERMVGPERLAGDTATVVRITELCGRLPLAVRVAGAKLAAKPHWTVTELAGRLADERRRLGELVAGDLDVRASMAVSYHGLREPERRAFRLLGLLPMPDFPAWPVAALLDVDLDTGEALAERLVDAQLLQVAGRDPLGQARYQLHDLVRVFAAEQVVAQEPVQHRICALQRVLAGYRDLARAADEVLRPGMSATSDDAGDGGRSPDPWVLSRAVKDPAEWFAVERINLVSAATRARGAGLPGLACDLSDHLFGFLEMRTHWDDWSVVAEVALVAARDAGDRHAQARALSAHGYLRWDQGRPEEAVPYFQESLALLDSGAHRLDRANVLVDLAAAYVSVGEAAKASDVLDRSLPVLRRLRDRRGEAFAAHMQGRAHWDQGRSREATRCFRRSVDLFRQLGDRRWQAYSLVCLGSLLRIRGRLDEAAEWAREALTALRPLRDGRWEAYALRVLGGICHDQHRPDAAVSHYLEALRLVGRIGATFGEAHTRRLLGDVYRDLGRLPEASSHLYRSLAMFRELGNRRGEALALLSLGDLARARRRYEESLTDAGRSLGLFREAGLRLWEAQALTSVGETLVALGRPNQARRRWREALTLLRRTGSPEADRVARLLRGLP